MSSHDVAVRIETIKELGKLVEHQFDMAKAALAEANGMRAAVALILKTFEDNLRKLEADLAEGKVEQEQYRMEKQGLSFAMGIVRDLLFGNRKLDALQPMAEGRVQVLNTLNTQFGKLFATEQQRWQEIRDVESREEAPTRVVGAHPGDPLAALRIEEQPPEQGQEQRS